MLGGTALLLALFGSAYLGTKCSNDKRSHTMVRREYEADHKREEEKRKVWEASVINKKLEAELEDRLYRGDEELLQELRDTWHDYYEYNEFLTCYVPKDKSMCSRRGAETGCFGAVTNLNGLRMLMANRGYLTALDAYTGIDIYCAANTRAEELENSRIMKYFVQAIDRKLRKHGKCQPMYIGISGSSEYYSFYSTRFIFGNVKWEPALPSAFIKKA